MNYIWDIDGTLANSYEMIVEILFRIEQKAGFSYTKEEILKTIKVSTVGAFERKMVQESSITMDEIYEMYGKLTNELISSVKPEVHARETLEFLKDRGDRHFVFTHRDNTTFPFLDSNNLTRLFDEVVTTETRNCKFEFKPSPAVILYLIEKYNLKKDETFYVGDRTLDVLSGFNAGVKTILYLPKDSVVTPTGKETFIVDDLLKICDL